MAIEDRVQSNVPICSTSYETTYPRVKLDSSFRKFNGRQHRLINRYGIYVPQVTTGMFRLSQSES